MTRSAPRGSPATSRSPTRTVPGGASQSLARRSPSVDLPLPVGPTTATVSPAPTLKLTPRSAGGRPSYANVTSANRMDGALVVAGSARPARTVGGLLEERLDSVDPSPIFSSPATTALSVISCIRCIDVKPRRTIDSVQPSAIVGHARYAR